ncbi:helix-turn-helix domain-containing protein [Streptomyces sp. ISL-96]|uniref:helix-turn-helix domain-containing protein n=1 Tax=Streptomyces sp. ISL-96 TaxID=2819191 RepID=UPI001BE5B749|nr:helix-turn-helix domain-containing protein [Streptomyces sp. ISL-96]MBT2492337.1 helix-turn-helix domain-containing protein [Streptomyces sp. ISL-96]
MASTSTDRVQTVRNAWINRLRDEVLRSQRAEVAKCARVGVWIATYADADGSSAFPSNDTLAALAGCTDETVTRAVKVLIAVGLLVRRRRPNRSSIFQLMLPPGRLDWNTHLHLYTDTRQARRKKAEKAREIEERNPSQDGVRNPFQEGGPEPVPAGGSDESGNRSGTGTDTVSRRVPEPVPAGGDHYPPTYGRDPDTHHDTVAVEPQPQERVGARGGKGGVSPEEEKPWGTCANAECGVRLLRATSGLCHGCQKKAEGAQQDPQAPVQGVFLTQMPSGPTGDAAAPHAGTQPVKIPAQDPAAPLRVCACGRQHRAHKPTDRCPDCLWAQHAQAVGR